MKVSFITKITFLKWLWIDVAITIPSCLLVFIILSLLKANILFYILAYSIMLPISLYFIIKVSKGQKRRIYEYTRLFNIFNKNKNNIKKSILYEMRYTKCEQPIVSKLCKDFSINL